MGLGQALFELASEIVFVAHRGLPVAGDHAGELGWQETEHVFEDVTFVGFRAGQCPRDR